MLYDNNDISNNHINYEKWFELFPSLQILQETPQDKYYHAEGDVWTHTKMVLDALHTLDEYRNASPQDREIMYLAALLHDISKPACTVHEDDGRITSKGHSKRGAIDSRIMLWKLDYPFYMRESICNIIATHQVPFFAFDDKPKNDKIARTPEYIAISLSWQLPLNCLLAVAKADMLGRDYAEKQKAMDDILLFEELCKELNCYDKKYIFPDEVTRLEYFLSNGAIASNYPFFKETGSNVYVMCGLPASGKSTWIKNNNPNLPVVSFDEAKETLGLKQSDNHGSAYQMVVSMAKEMLRKSEPFIWDATHLSPLMRNKTLNLLLDYNAYITLVYCEQPEKTIKSRNILRNTTLSNKKIDEMLFKWEVPTEIETHETLYFINN